MPNNDYVKREDIFPAVTEIAKEIVFGNQDDDKVVDIINSIPAADVEPVRYGQWVKTAGMAPPEFAGSYHCSECGWHGRSRKEREYKRCPECGAKMDAEPPKGEDDA